MHSTWTLLVIQLLSYQALGFLFTNERSNQCPSLSAETAFIEYIDNVTMLIEIPKELELVQELTFHSGECNVNYHMAPVTLDVEYQEKGDISTQMLSYDKNVILPISPLIRTAKFAFDEPLYTERIKLRSSYPLGCVRVHVNGCGTSGMCRRETSPCGYNGICIGEQRCACTPPYVGRICNSKANDILIDDYSPILQMQKVVFTKAGKLQTYGNVTVVQDDSTGRRSRRTFGYFGGHHYYQMHGGSCMPQTSQSYPSSNFYGHHCSSSPYSVFHNSHNNGFSHSCNAIFGHSHDHQTHTYFYTTHGHNNQHNTGVSFYHHNNQLNMCVNSGQHTYTVNAPFYPNAGQNYHFSSSISHNTGVSMYVNGQLVGSQTKPSNNHYNPNAGHQQPLCFGSCGSNPAPGSQNVNMANSIMAGAGIHDLMTNSLLGCLGTTALNIITSTLFPKPGNLFPWLHPQSKSTLPTTTTYATPIAPFSAATSAPTLPTVGKRGPLCYDCHDQSSINSCTNLTQCDQTQVCLVFEHIDGFEHRCMEKNKCSQLQSVSTNLCWTCCSEDLCNKHCTPTQQHRVPTPVTTVKTTQPPFTVSATSPIASNIVQTMCSDNPQCAQLVTAGYSVCSDPVVSRSLCKNKCSNCP